MTTRFAIDHLSGSAMARHLAGSLSFTSSCAFSDGVAESANSILFYDTDLTNGHSTFFDIHEAPSNLAPAGPQARRYSSCEGHPADPVCPTPAPKPQALMATDSPPLREITIFSNIPKNPLALERIRR